MLNNHVPVKVLNYTRHDLVFYGPRGERVHTVKVSGTIRSASHRKCLEPILTEEGKQIPVNMTTFGECKDLPPERPGYILVVPSLIASNLKGSGRGDIYVPDEVVKSSEGNVMGLRSIAKMIL